MRSSSIEIARMDRWCAGTATNTLCLHSKAYRCWTNERLDCVSNTRNCNRHTKTHSHNSMVQVKIRRLFLFFMSALLNFLGAARNWEQKQRKSKVTTASNRMYCLTSTGIWRRRNRCRLLRTRANPRTNRQKKKTNNKNVESLFRSAAHSWHSTRHTLETQVTWANRALNIYSNEVKHTRRMVHIRCTRALAPYDDGEVAIIERTAQPQQWFGCSQRYRFHCWTLLHS